MINVELASMETTCGGEVLGTVLWHSDKQPVGLRVALRWFTEGRGDRNSADVVTYRWTWEQGIPAPLQFAFAVPFEGPCSYDGELLRIIWEVRATLELSWGRDPNEAARLIVLPRRVALPAPSSGL